MTNLEGPFDAAGISHADSAGGLSCTWLGESYESVVERSARLTTFGSESDRKPEGPRPWCQWSPKLASKGGIAPVRRGLHFLEYEIDGKYLHFVFARLHLALNRHLLPFTPNQNVWIAHTPDAVSSLTSVLPSMLTCPEMETAFVEFEGFEPAGLASAAFEECCARAVSGKRNATTRKINIPFFIAHPRASNRTSHLTPS
jgi:hypothetical protein